MRKKILVAVDPSVCSRHAMQYAARLVEQVREVDFVLLHIQPTVSSYLVDEACFTTNRVGPDTTDHDPEVVHAISVASMHGEFCTNLSPDQALSLLDGDAPDLDRAQGNE